MPSAGLTGSCLGPVTHSLLLHYTKRANHRHDVIFSRNFKIISLYLLPFSSESRSKSQVVCSHTYCGCFQSSETNLPRAGNIRLYCAQELLVYYLFSTLPQTGPAGQAGVQPASLGSLTFGNCDSFSLSLLYCTSTRLPYIR